ncbi:MAG: hypothetical protein ABIV12_08610 [Dokdonella sp.]|uniref:hypothetical protein n=1 Tax=Dokdonella sp. TaxID=2291710 RepID=UPI0032630E7F
MGEAHDQQFALLARASVALAICSFAALAICLVLFVVHFGRQFFGSDDAVVNMLAETMWQQGRLLPRHWINNNGDLMMPSIALIVAPLLNWFPNSFGLHSIGGVFAAVILLGSLMRALRAFAIPWIVVLFVATLMASGFCSSFITVVYTQTTYFWWPAGFFMGATLIYNHRQPSRSVRSSARWRIALLATLIFSVSFANPARVAVMMVLPLYVFDRVLHVGSEQFGRGHSGWLSWLRFAGFGDPLALIGIVSSFLLSMLIYAEFVHAGITQPVYGAAALHWGGWPSVWRHLLTFKSWFIFLGAPSGPPFASLGAINALAPFRWAISLWLTWVAVSESVKLVHQRDVLRRALASAMLVAYLFVAIPYVLFDPLAVNGSTLRYFIVPNCMAVLLCAFPLRWLVMRRPASASAGLAVASAMLAFVAAPFYIPVRAIGSPGFWTVGESKTMRLARILQREQLRWGYATWWNAGATMVHARSSVQLSPVIFTPTGLVPFWSMVSTDWYKPEAWQGETFLVADDSEYKSADVTNLQRSLGQPLRQIDESSFHIMIFDHNVSADFASAKGAKKNRGIAPVDLTRGATAIDDCVARHHGSDAPTPGLEDAIFASTTEGAFAEVKKPGTPPPSSSADAHGARKATLIFRSCFD